MSIQDVINRYHEHLTDELAEQTDTLMRQRLLEEKLYFGKRPLCIVLRPHFYLKDDWDFMKRGLETLMGAFRRAQAVCFTNPAYRQYLHLYDWEETLYKLDAGGPLPWSSSRLDTFFVEESRILKCVEYNAETPAGIGYSDVLATVFDELEPMKSFRDRYHLTALPILTNLQDAILSAYKKWGGNEPKPQIGILDWRDVPTIAEHEITRDHFERAGIKTRLADPRALDYRNGKLYADDFRIDIVYKRVLYSELIERMGMNNAVVTALRNRSVYMTNSPSAKLMAKKASLAFLSDERHATLFTPEQLQSIQAHIPWSRVVEDRKTYYEGREIDLIPYIARHKDRFVLKPNDDYGGKGVVIGWECSADGWEASLLQAMESPFVVQERVPIVQRDFPSWINGALDYSPRYVDADPYVFNGQTVDGIMTRLSPLSLLNVTAGGGSVVPVYLVEEKG